VKHQVNLIPAPILAARARRARLRAWIAIDTLVAGALCATLATAHPQSSGLIDRLAAEHESARVDLATAQEHLAATADALRGARAQEAVAQRLGARPDFSGLLRTISMELDERATLDQVLIAPLAEEPREPESPAPPDPREIVQQAVGMLTGAAPAPQPPPPEPARERYHVLLSGMATSAGVASEFVLRLERTGYFSSVTLTSTSGRDFGTIRAVDFRITGVLGEGRLAVAEESP
jgi:hypothetical protein